MGKRFVLSSHLSVEELQRRHQDCADPTERRHWRLLWLLALGRTTQEVAEGTGYSIHWVRRLARRYNQMGPEAVIDKRTRNQGRKPLLDDVAQAELAALLARPHPDGEVWNSVTVAAWIAHRIGRPVDNRRGWKYLRQLGFAPQRTPKAPATRPTSGDTTAASADEA